MPKGALGFETTKGPPQYARLGVDGESVPACGEVQEAAAVLVNGPLVWFGVPLGALAADPGIVSMIAAIAKQPRRAKLIFWLRME